MSADPSESSTPSVPASNLSLKDRTCEVYFQEKWYNAEILSIRVDDQGVAKAAVKFIGVDQAREYTVSDLKLLPLSHPNDFPSGTRVQAIWKDDGLWYNGTVKEVVGKGTDNVTFVIVYDGFENDPQTVKPDQIRKPIVINKPTVKVTPQEEKAYVTPAGYRIPEKLRIDPSKDSEKVIADKKRKIHQIKSQQRTENFVEQVTTNKSAWQQFQKVAKR